MSMGLQCNHGSWSQVSSFYLEAIHRTQDEQDLASILDGSRRLLGR